MHVYMCVYTYVCLYTCMFIQMHICPYWYIHTQWDIIQQLQRRKFCPLKQPRWNLRHSAKWHKPEREGQMHGITYTVSLKSKTTKTIKLMRTEEKSNNQALEVRRNSKGPVKGHRLLPVRWIRSEVLKQCCPLFFQRLWPWLPRYSSHR